VQTDMVTYLTQRIEAIGETPTSLSRRLGWGNSYITNVMNEQFKPSEKRCKEISRAFGDDPNILLGLAGFYVPHEFSPDEEALLSAYRSLRPRQQRDARRYLGYLKYVEDTTERDDS